MGQRLDNAKALYLEAIRDGNYEEAINRYAGDRYTQHSTPVKDGKAGFIEFFAEFVDRNRIRDIEILRGFEDGPYVFLHVLQTLNDGEFRYVTADIFDTDGNGKLIEHWDIIAEVDQSTASGPTQIDGPLDPTDLDKTEPNKALVRRYLDLLGDGGHDKADDYFSSIGFIEHSSATNEQLVYAEVHNVIGSGSFVAALSHVQRGPEPLAVIDLFRIEDGVIAEHWDVAEVITPANTWVNTGKF